jgi:hypothetical protein
MQIIRTAKLSDREVIDALKQLSERFDDSSSSITIALDVRRDLNDLSDYDDPIFSNQSRNVQSATFTFGPEIGQQVSFARGLANTERLTSHPQSSVFVSSRLPSGAFDEWGFFNPPSSTQGKTSLSADDKIYVSELLNKFADPLQIGSDDDARQLSAVASKQIGDLRSLAKDFMTRLADARESDEAEFKRRLSQLENSFAKRLEYVSGVETELEVKKKELNDREPKHERRRIRGDLTSRLQSAISEPKLDTIEQERRAYHLFLTVGAAFVVVSLAASYVLYSNASTASGGFWILSLKGLASGALGAGLIWSGLAGLKNSSVAARLYEQRIQKYAFDMDRASWIVETLIEMNSLEAANVPDEWLESVCHDLFAIDGGKVEEPKALGALAALLDATAGAKVGTNGLEFQIDRKGAKQMSKEAGV